MAGRTDGPHAGCARASGRLEHAALGGTFNVTTTPLINEDGEPVGNVLVARDITRQTALEAEKETLRAQLAQSEKLASLGQFVAGIAHEINNPLQGVLGHLELLMWTLPDRRRRPSRVAPEPAQGSAPHLPRGRSRGEDRQQPADFHRARSA